MIAPWKSFAEANGNILVAPTLPFGGTFEPAVALQLYPMMMDAARREWNIDPRRMYLFGVSAGGYKVFDASIFDSRYFAAGICLPVITPDCAWIMRQATRKIPIAIYIGDHDEFSSVTHLHELHSYKRNLHNHLRNLRIWPYRATKVVMITPRCASGTIGHLNP